MKTNAKSSLLLITGNSKQKRAHTLARSWKAQRRAQASSCLLRNPRRAWDTCLDLSPNPTQFSLPQAPEESEAMDSESRNVTYIEMQRKGEGVCLLKQKTEWMLEASGSTSAGHNEDKRGAFQWTDVISKRTEHTVNGLYLCTFKPSSRKTGIDWSKIEVLPYFR